MDQPEKMKLTSMDVAEEKREELKQCLKRRFPEVFAEDKIDIDQLKRVLGEWVDAGKERFGLNWPGKAECMKIIQQPSIATLKPCREESVNFDETENLFIEGDNLEVLKLLQKSYFGKVKMIYIDPPYNTGREFIYPDKYSETLETYLAYTGQVDDEGKKFSSNTETTGRFHSRWLNMMYPRLYLAKNLLRDDGIIFLSIGDDELARLRQLCDEIFGEENFIGQVTWKARVKPVNIGEAKYRPQKEVEYVLIYQKDFCEGVFQPLITGGQRSYPHDIGGRKYRLATILKSNRGVNYRSTMTFEVAGYTPPDGQRWQAGEEVIRQLYEDGYIEFRDGTPFRRYFEDEEGAEHDPFYCFMEVDWSSTSEAGKHELNELIGNRHGFDTVKPTRLIKTLIQSCTIKNANEIILDFFAGSATTAHSVLALNNQDGGSRKFIMVQLPETCEADSEAFNAGFKTIADIGKERIRRVIQKLQQEHEGELALEDGKKLDLGFRLFKLDRSNFKVWDGDLADADEETLKRQLEMHVEHVSEESSQEDVLYELLLKAGFPLTTKVEAIEMAGKQVFSIEHGAMLICLEDEVTPELIDAMAEADPLQVICLDRAFAGNDQLKTNAVQTFKARAASKESEIVFMTV